MSDFSRTPRRSDRRPWNRTTLHRLIRAAPAQPARRRHLAGRIRTSVPHRRRVVLGSAELRRVERSRRESNPPHPGDSRAAPAGRVRELMSAWSPGESNPAPVVASHSPGPTGSPVQSDRRDSNPVRSAGNAVCFRPDTTVASRSAPSGVRTRVTGVRDRHPGRLDDRGM